MNRGVDKKRSQICGAEPDAVQCHGRYRTHDFQWGPKLQHHLPANGEFVVFVPMTVGNPHLREEFSPAGIDPAER